MTTTTRSTSVCKSFPPIEPPHARLLILGSMPGKASLNKGQYYAHPRNAFWPIMQHLIGLDPAWPYKDRLDALHSAGIALWDVLDSCERSSSMDQDIVPASETLNDIQGLLARHPGLFAVAANGQKAASLLRRHLSIVRQPTSTSMRTSETLTVNNRSLAFFALPSTSPASARLNLAAKKHQWEVLTSYLAI